MTDFVLNIKIQGMRNKGLPDDEIITKLMTTKYTREQILEAIEYLKS